MNKWNKVNGSIVDSKRTGFRLYKSGKRWMYSSSLMLSFFGFTVFHTSEEVVALAVTERANTKHADTEHKLVEGKAYNGPVLEYKFAQANPDIGGIGVNFLTNRTLNAIRNGSSALWENKDDNHDYTEIAHIGYSGTSLGLAATDFDFVLKVPTELQRLLNGEGESDVYGISTWDFSAEFMHIQEKIRVSADGSTYIVILDGVATTVNLDLGDMVNKNHIKFLNSNNSCQFDGALVVPGSPINWDGYIERIAGTDLATKKNKAAVVQSLYLFQPAACSMSTVAGTVLPVAALDIDDAA